jgi:fused signal recognition particle receptor
VAVLVVVVILIAVIVLGLAGLVVGTRRSSRSARRPAGGPTRAPGAVTEVAAGTATEPVDAGAATESTTAEPVAKQPVTEAIAEAPAAVAGRMGRLRGRLSRSQATLGAGLLGLLTRGRIDEDTWTEVEETLLVSDLGVGPTRELVDQLRTAVKRNNTSDPAEVKLMLRSALLDLVDPGMDRSINATRPGAGADVLPAVILIVGVNGTGKTTTAGKLARVLVADGKTVVLGAADTFRAAAVEQLQTWGDRVGVPTVRGDEGADPASVAFRAVSAGADDGVDVVLVDTAGRLHTKVGLMDELGKVRRVVEKIAPVSEVLLVLDATTGQNGLAQARVFAEAVDITGIALTKLDGTAKGGIVVAVQRELGVPVKLVGLGEGPDDLAPFDAETFVDALLG